MTFKAYNIDYGSSQNLVRFPWYGRMLLGYILDPNIATPNVTIYIIAKFSGKGFQIGSPVAIAPQFSTKNKTFANTPLK